MTDSTDLAVRPRVVRNSHTWFFILSWVSLVLFAAARGYAAGAFFLGTVNALGSSVGNPGQVTLDRQGNLWAVSNLNNSVVKWNGTSWVTVISGLMTPYGLSFDSSDNLFLGQTGTPGIFEYAAPGYSSSTQLTPSFDSPNYLAFDSNNNLFVADTGNSRVYEVMASGGYATKVSITGIISSPAGVALDLSNNLYVADLGGDIRKYTAASSYATETTLASSLNGPAGIAVDPGGNVYISEVFNGNLDRIDAITSNLATIYTNTSTSGSRGMVVGPGGVIYEGDYGGGSVYKITPGAVNVGTSVVGSAASTVTVTFGFTAAAAGVHTSVVTTGETARDFTINNSSAGTCGGTSATNSFSSGQTCTAIVQFAGSSPGLRTGAVQILNGNNSVLATGFLYGTGTAPLAAFFPANVSTVQMGSSLSPALSAPSNPAWRADGNLFFTDGTSSGRVLQIAPGSGAPTAVSTGSYTLQNPKGVAIDGAGNIFVCDAGNNRVLEISAGGTTTVAIPAGYGMGNVGQIAVDGSGAVYAADGANSRIVVAPPTGNIYILPISGLSLTTPAGVTVDANYNVYIADAGSNHIYKVSNGVGTTISTSSLATALSAPSSLTIDDNSTLYVSDIGNNRIVLIPISGPDYVLDYDYTTPLSAPDGVAFDLAGQMYIADSGNNKITQYDWTSIGYQFSNTPVGSLSSDSPFNVIFYNLGNSNLTIAVPDTGDNPSVTNTAFSLGTGTTCPDLTASSSPATLSPRANCILSINFQPLATGLTTDAATYTNNSLNVFAHNSVFSLVGFGTIPGDTTTLTFATVPATLYSGQSAAVSVTAADTTTPASIPTGSVSFSDSIQGSLGSAAINGSGVASLGSITFLGAGTHTITATYAGVSGTFAPSSHTAAITVSSAPAATFNTPFPVLNLGNTLVGQTSTTQTATFTFTTLGVIGQPQVLTLGDSGVGNRFTLAGGTCTSNGANTVYTAGATCTVTVSFTPAYPGVAMGAIQLVDLADNPLATAYIRGTGTGPQSATLPGTVTTVTVTGSYISTAAVAFDGAGNLYFVDSTGNQLFRVPAGGGAAVLLAGTGATGSGGDGGAATSAQLSEPSDIVLDGAGNMYIADYGNYRVRKIDAATGIITTFAGTGQGGGYTGDGGAATNARLNSPYALALDAVGNLYIADEYNDVIRKVTAATGIISTVAGNGVTGFSGDGGLAIQAQLSRPYGVAVDGGGNLYIADKDNNRIRFVSSTSGQISTVAGNGSASDSGDGGPATQAGLDDPLSVAVDPAGNLAVVEAAGIRRIFAGSGTIETTAVTFGAPSTLREDNAGNLYTEDVFNNGLFVISPSTSFNYATTTGVGTSDTTDGAMPALLFNTGNTALNAVAQGLTAPADFAKVAGPGTPADCTPSFSLSAGSVCTLAIEFEPTVSGSLSESFVITDNALNSSSTTQSIGLTGSALPAQATLAVTGVPTSAQPYGATFTVSSGGGSGTGAVTFGATGACTISGAAVTISAGSGVCSVTATKAADETYPVAVSAPATVAASLAAQTTLTVTGVPGAAQAYASTFSVGSSGGTGTGAVTFAATGACSVAGSTVTVTSGSGTCSVAAIKATDGNYAAATSAAVSVAASTATQATLIVTGVPTLAQPYGAAFTVGTSGGNGTGAVTFTATGTCSASGTTITITGGSGTCSVTAAKATDGDYAAATSAAATVAATLANQATLAVAGVPNTAQPYGASFTVDFSGGSGTGAVTFAATGSCSIAARTVTITAASGACSVTAIKASDGHYASATSAPATVSAALASQTVSFSSPPAVVPYPSAPIALSATGGASGEPVVFSVVSGPGSIAGSALTLTGTGTVVVAANQAGNDDYAAAPQVTHSLLSAVITLTANVTSLLFGDQAVGSTSGAQTVIVINPYALAVPLTSISASGDFTASANCPTIPANGNCSVEVTFTPSATGALSGTLSVVNPFTETPLTISLTGTGATAGLATTPSNLIFGSQAVATTSLGAPLVLANTGNAPLTIANIVTTGDFAATGNCASIPAGTSCTLTLTFTPSATGSRIGAVTLTSNAGGAASTQTIQLQGSGSAAGVTLSTASAAFPATVVGTTSAAFAVTLGNGSSSALTGIVVSTLGDFAQTNNCSATLAPGADCTISITYTPSIAGAETGQLNIAANQGPQLVTLAGTGLAPGATLSTSALLFGGQLIGASSSARTVVFTNTGGGAITFTSITLPANFTDTTDCTGSIAPGSGCSINVTFTPTSANVLSGVLALNDSAGTQQVSLSGVGVAAVLAVSPSFVLFGSQQQNTVSQAQTLVVSNTSSAAVALGTVIVTNNFVESDNCSGATLPAGGNCSIATGFAPSAGGGLSGSLTIASADQSVSTVAVLQGQGSGANLSIQPALVSFGSQTIGVAGPAQIVTLWNTGSNPLSVGAVSASGDFAQTGTCSNATLAPGANCVLSITMTPTTLGTRTGTIQFVDSLDGPQTISLSGVGQQPGIGLSTPTMAFGSLPIVAPSQASSAPGTEQTVVVTNSGTSALSLTSIQASGDFHESDTCGTSLAAGSQCTITVTFVPVALGHRTGSLTLNSNALVQQTVSLAGDGSPVGLTLSPPILNFGLQTVGTASIPLTAVLANNTGQAITQLAISASGEYSETDDCGATLANGSNCALQITVLPTTVGAITGTISVSSGGVVLLGAERAGLGGARSSSENKRASLIHPLIAAGNANANIGTVATNANTIPSGAALGRLAYGAPPAAAVAAGGNAGSAITLIEEDANGHPVSGTDTITVTVTGPGGYAHSYTATAAAGTALFDLSNAALTASGGYSYVAALSANPGVSAASAMETVAPGAAAVVHAVGSGQSAILGSPFALPLTAKVTDSYGNAVGDATIAFTAPASGASAVLSASTAMSDAGGNAAVNAVANNISGSYSVTAAVNGAASASFLLMNGKASPSLSIAAGGSSVFAGAAVTFTATISSSDGQPGGSVSFLDGSTALGSANIVAGAASFTTASLASGAHSVTAVYSGDANFGSVTSSALTLNVLDFMLSADPSSSPGLVAGQSVTYTLAIKPNAGTSLPAVTTLTLTGLPAGASAAISLPWTQTSVNTWTLPSGTTYAPIPMLVTTSATATASNPEQQARGSLRMAWCLALAPLVWPWRRAKGRRKAAARWIVLLTAALAATVLSGCGGYGFYGHVQKTYTLTVTASAATLSHSASVSLTIE